MKFADNLFELYLRHFNDKDSLEVFIRSVLEQMDHEDLLEVMQGCPKEELNEMLGKYLNDQLETKITGEYVPQTESRNLH
ncbi:DUF6154 family protein [Sediminibacillus massiliensis]|uniref:DUF6154 family protein n=1 Tax=Sediminibacillus massiliensis TaxID=1926277 RepID=UPI0009887F2A|nr:DUF6154 family protein [Sediminibacillus massiliensis]